jgi:hypothetical protein
MKKATFGGQVASEQTRGRDVWLMVGTIMATFCTMLTVVLQASL